jgi:hypothetical protein
MHGVVLHKAVTSIQRSVRIALPSTLRREILQYTRQEHEIFYVRFEFLSPMTSWEYEIFGCDAVQSGSIVSDGPAAYIIEAQCSFSLCTRKLGPTSLKTLVFVVLVMRTSNLQSVFFGYRERRVYGVGSLRLPDHAVTTAVLCSAVKETHCIRRIDTDEK